MSAMSASSGPGLMPLSLISEHKAAQGGPPPVQPLARTPEKHSLVQAPKPTPNGMEPSPPLVPLLPPSQPEPQPNLPCGGKSEVVVSDGERSGGTVPEMQPAEPAPPSIGAVPEQPMVAEPAKQPAAPEQEAAASQAPPSPAPAPPQQPPPVMVPPKPTAESQLHREPSPQPASLPVAELTETVSPTTPAPEPVATSQPSDEPVPAEAQQPPSPQQASAPSPTPATTANDTASPSEPAISTPTPPTPAPTAASSARQSKRTKQSGTNGTGDKKAPAPLEKDESGDDDRKSKRKRLPTQPYQSPIPELNIIAKISKIDKTPAASDDKLIVFYRNEFLAVRNAEGGFYVCQAMQNVYKTSSRIRIRWLSQVANTDHYSPDFYDNTEFDCILTNLNLERIDKNKYRLPDIESQRTQSILKRAIDVEKGIAPPEETSITEEHPDGLDLSLYRNEEQLKKRKRGKSKSKQKKEKIGNNENVEKRSRSSGRKGRPAESDSKKSALSQRRVGRPVKVEKPVVQRIVAAKKLGVKRKAASGAGSPVKKLKKNEDKGPLAPTKRRNESQSAPVPEKKMKSGASKTRSGVAGGPSGAQPRGRRAASRTK